MSVDLSNALDLRVNHGLTYKEIGAIEGVSKQAIHTALKTLLPDQDEVESFKDYRADIITAQEIQMLKALNALTTEEQKDMVKRRGMVDYGILHDKEFQARGLSDGSSKPLVVIQVRGDRSTIAVTCPNTDAIDVPSTSMPLITQE